MDSLFGKIVFFMIVGTLIAAIVSGNCWPFIIAVAAIIILIKVFSALSK